MPGVFGGKAFAFKNVAQVAAAMGADDLRAASVGVGQAAHGLGQGVVKAGPAAAGVKLVFGAEQGCAALAAEVSSRRLGMYIGSAEGRFRGLVQQDGGFLRRKWGHGGHQESSS